MMFTLMFILVSLWNGAAAADIKFSTLPQDYNYISLAEYGYEYTPVDNCLAYITFQVKACHDVHVGLFEAGKELYTYQIAFGGWMNTQSRIINSQNAYVDHLEDNLVDCDAYRSFWVSWRNNNISIGLGTSYMESTILSLIDAYPYQIRHVSIMTGFGAYGEWKIPDQRPPMHCDGNIWLVKPGHQNINMTTNITWSVTTANVGLCALACNESQSCISFVYNNIRHKCQGHGLNFNKIIEGQGHAQSGSIYFSKP